MGRDCDVFDVGDGTVLRRARSGRSLEGEAAVMEHARRHGYPCPRVHRAEGPDLVLDLVPGPTMLDDLVLDVTVARASEGGALLGELHDRLHRIPGVAGGTLLHLDLHPANVIMSPDGPVVIDWTNATDGEPGFDVAMTWVILVPFVPLFEEPLTAMIDRLLEGRRGVEARAHLAAAARRRIDDKNTTDDERAAVEALLRSSG